MRSWINRDDEERTALSHAADADHVDVVAEFVASGTVVDTADEDYASQYGHRAVVTKLFQRGVFDSSSDFINNVALFVAVAIGDLEPLQELISKGESVNVATQDGRTLLCYAVKFGKADVVQFLIKNGTSVRVKLNSTESRTGNPLTQAGHAGHMQVYQALIEAEAPINIRSGNSGETPLILVARWGVFSGGVQILFTHGGGFRFEDVQEDEYPLILGTLETMGKLCAETFEFDHVCGRVVERLRDICSQLQLRDTA